MVFNEGYKRRSLGRKKEERKKKGFGEEQVRGGGEEKLRRFQKRGSGAEKSGVRGDWDGKEVNNREQREGNASEKKENGGKEPEKGETQV